MLEKLLAEKEAQARLFDATLSSINDLAYSFDLEGNWMYANKALLELWGRTLPEIVGKSSLELNYPPELAETLKSQVKQVVRTRKPFRGETFFTSGAGVVDYHEYIFSPVFGPDGSVTAVCGTTRLITERKRAEENAQFLIQLGQKAALVRDPVEINRLVASELGKFLGVSRCFFSEWKSGPPEILVRAEYSAPGQRSLVGKHNLYNFISQQWSETLQSGALAIADVQTESISQPLTLNLEAWNVRAYAASSVLKQDAVAYNLTVTADQPRKWREDEITLLENVAARIWPLIERARSEESLRQSEEQLRLALSAGNLGHWSWEAATDAMNLSERTREIYGVAPGTHITRTEARRLLHPEDAEEARKAMLRSIENRADYDVQYRLNGPSGAERWIAAKGRPIYAEDGKILGMLGVASDITIQKKAERDLRKRGERMQLLSDTLAQLLNARDPNTIVRELFPKVAQHLDVDTYFNFMVNEEGNALELHSCAGIPEETARSIRRLEYGQAICGTVAQIRQPIVANDIQNSDYDKAALVRGFGLQTYACNPLMVEDRLLGTLSFASRTRASFDAEELEFIRVISQHTAIALDRLKTAQALRESSERLAASLAAAETGTFRWNIRTNSLDWDDPLDRLFGLVPRNTVRSLQQFIERVHPDDRPGVIARCERCAQDGVDFDMEFRVIWPDGSIHWLDDKGKVFFGQDGRPDYMTGACVDITERKASEAQLVHQKEVLEQIVQGAPLPDLLEGLTRGVEEFSERKLIATILIMDPDGTHLRSIAGKNAPAGWIQVIDGVKIGPCVGSCGTSAFLREPVIVSDIANDPLWKNYKDHALHYGLRACWSTPLLSSEGEVLGTFAIYYSEPTTPTQQELKIVEIATRTAAIAIERQSSEQALKDSRAKLEVYARTLEERVKERTADLLETNEQLEQFCYTIAHDLRAPLRAQEGFANLLKEDFAETLGTKGQNYANKIVAAARRLDRLVQDLLNFSRIGRGSWQIQPVELRNAFEESQANLADSIRNTNATVTVGALEGTVRAHPATLMLILQNLLANALKFVAPGNTPRAHVWTEDKGEYVRFNVKDEGIGIPAEYHERIFGVFERLHDAGTYPGTGIGLSLVRKGIERMGGRIGLDSAPQKGSLFWIELPKAQERSPET